MYSLKVATETHILLETMPISYQINRSRDLTVFTLSGQVLFSELTDSLSAYGKDGTTVYELYDLRKLRGERLSTVDIERLVGYFNLFANTRPNNSKTAVVVKEDIDFGISKTVALLTEIDGVVPYQINVFRAMDDALKWLDLDADALAP